MAEVERGVRERGERARRPGSSPRCASAWPRCGAALTRLRPAVAWAGAAFVLLVGVVGGLRRH